MEDKEKVEILKKNGYREVFERELYYNRDSKIILSREWIGDSTLTDIQKILDEKSEKSSWLFYSAFPLQEDVKRELCNELKIETSIDNIPLYNIHDD